MLPVARVIAHKEWTPRKIDPRVSMTWRRQRVAAFTPRNRQTEDDMPTPADLLNAKVSDETGSLRDTVRDARVISRRTEIKVEALTNAITALTAAVEALTVKLFPPDA